MFSKSVFVFGLLVAASALAGHPKVGDLAVYDYASSKAQGRVGRLELRVSAADVAANTATVTNKLTLSNQTQTTFDNVALSDLETADEILQRCGTDDFGVKEAIDVPAGHFETCRLSFDRKTMWISAIPVYGFVKYLDEAAEDGARIEWALRSFVTTPARPY